MTRTQIINHYIRKHNYTSYLEIGVYDGKNFNAINCKHKVSVDPDEKTPALVHMTSDEYFSKLDPSVKVGLIFIDGLHHSDQVERDINNALAHLSEGGTIIVHDCNPTTEEMQIVPRMQGVWTGDVWKAWVKFRQRPDLSMWVHDCDYGVGVIQRGSQVPMLVDEPTYNQFSVHKLHWLPLVPPPMEISVVIPYYDQRGMGKKYLCSLLSSLVQQMNVNFEVCISANDRCIDVVKQLDQVLNITYREREERGVSANTNAAIEMANSDKIKIMYQDDFLYDQFALRKFADVLDDKGWVISGSIVIDGRGNRKYRNQPYFEQRFDANKTGMPSVIAFNRCAARFDTTMHTFLDLDFYHQLYRIYGQPAMLREPLVAQRYHDASQSRNQEDRRGEESLILKERYQ